MPYNGSGVFTLYSTGNPVVTGTTISSTWANNTLQDIANNGLSNTITKDGQTTVTANIPLGGFKITGLGAGAAATDAAQLGQVQSSAVTLLGTIAGTDTITAVATPTLAAYAAGQTFRFVSAGANTGAVTLNINGLGAKAITKDGTTALVAGDIISGAVIEVTYDGTRFQLLSNKPNTVANGGTGLTSLTANRIPVGNGTGAFLSYATFSFNGTTMEAPQLKPSSTAGIVGTTTNDNADAGSVGEYVESVGGPASFPTSGQLGDATSIPLTAGDWDVTAVGYVEANGATVNNFDLGISTTTGNSATGLTLGSNRLEFLPPTSASDMGGTIPSYRMSLSGSATVYFKFVGTYSVATPRMRYRLSARRVR